MKFDYLALPDNAANILIVRKEVFNLTNNYNFNHDEALSLLSPACFKERLLKICNRQQGNLHRRNRRWDESMREKTKLDHPASDQRMRLSQLDRRFKSQKNMNPEACHDDIIEANDLSSFMDSADTTMLTENGIWNAFAHSFKTQWLTAANEFNFIDDKVKFLNFAKTKFEEEKNECLNKKRKYDNNNDQSSSLNDRQQNCHIANQQGSQVNCNPNNNNSQQGCYFFGRTNHKTKDCRDLKRFKNNQLSNRNDNFQS